MFIQSPLQLHPVFDSSLADWLCLPELAFAVFGRSNKALALKVLSKRGEGIWEASTSLKDDPEVILTAMKTYPAAFANASDRLRDSYFFAVDAITINPGAIRFASQRVQVMLLEECVGVSL